jgi:hypothetical protein
MQTIDGKNYYIDAQGRLVPESLVDDLDKERDKLVRELCAKAKEQNASLNSFNEWVIGEIMAFRELSLEKHGVKCGGDKGNATLPTHGGEYKIQVSVAERLDVNEQITAAKALVDECLTEWTTGSRDEIKLLVQDAFKVDGKGQLNIRSLLSLRKLNITDDRWQRAMTAIGDSFFTASSKQYVRFYERQDDGQYKAISLDIAAM